MQLGLNTSTGSVLFRGIKVLIAVMMLELLLFVTLVVLHAAQPALAPAWIPESAGVFLGLTSVVALSTGVVYALVAYPGHRVPILFLVLVTASTLGEHLFVIGVPSLPDCRDSAKNLNGCIMDEVYYVPTAESMLNGTQCSPSVPNCNLEHPFLSKALIAVGIATFGDGAFGWRIFNVLLGSFSLPLLFILTMRLSGSHKASSVATLLLALDVMFFSHSSAALIDVPMVFFALLGFVLFVCDLAVWKLDKFTLAGVSLGLAILSKETAIFLVATLVTYNFLVGEGDRRQRILSSAELLIVAGGVFIFGLQAYDSLFASAAFPTFLVSGGKP